MSMSMGRRRGGGRKQAQRCAAARAAIGNIYAHLFLRQVSGRTEHCRHRSQYAYHQQDRDERRADAPTMMVSSLSSWCDGSVPVAGVPVVPVFAIAIAAFWSTFSCCSSCFICCWSRCLRGMHGKQCARGASAERAGCVRRVQVKSERIMMNFAE